ncbi:hypothetical protein QR680_010601 [Steinernema hermaphroditum]|uniref:Major facilitator superfamily (MFS) profile domain-containing protein n=1 Tax=Steinernema hermaphroditum TaxID=289476 RepID=A0AA39IPJ1_9BILA|nr:hypothetical protein QR680_010601 [Steinernema hermaphroditum]
MLFVRFCQGFPVSVVFAALGSIPQRWGGCEQRGRFVAILSSSYQIAPIFAMVLAAAFCSSAYGWEGVYYLFGITTILSGLVFFVLYSDTPLDTRLFKIKQLPGIAVKPPNKTGSVPYKAIFTSLSVWALWLTAFGDALGHQMFLMYGPTYMNKVLKFNIAQTGLLAALPFLLCIAVKVLAGMFLDKAGFPDIQKKTRLLSSGSQAAMTLCFALLIALPATASFLSQIVFTCIILFSGLHNVGLFSGCQIVAKQFSHVLTLVISMEIGTVALILPGIVSSLAPHNEESEVSG